METIDLLRKSMDWFLYESGLRHEKVKVETFRLLTARIKINQIPCVIFQITSQLFFKHCVTLQCYET